MQRCLFAVHGVPFFHQLSCVACYIPTEQLAHPIMVVERSANNNLEIAYWIHGPVLYLVFGAGGEKAKGMVMGMAWPPQNTHELGWLLLNCLIFDTFKWGMASPPFGIRN